MNARREPFTTDSEILNQRSSKGAVEILQADEIKQILRGQDPEEALDKALDDDAAEDEHEEELQEADAVDRLAGEAGRQ